MNKMFSFHSMNKVISYEVVTIVLLKLIAINLVLL